MGSGRRLREGKDVAVLSIGPIGNEVERAITELEDEGKRISVAHYDMRFLKPLDEHLLSEIGHNFDRIITIEDGIRAEASARPCSNGCQTMDFTPPSPAWGCPTTLWSKAAYSSCMSWWALTKNL